MTSALRQFMPYGAPDLIEGAARRLFRATLSGIGFTTIVYAATLGWSLVRTNVVQPERTIVVPYRELAAPPPLAEAVAPPPVITVTQSIKAPAVGVPVPVPDVEAPAERTIASQEEIAASTGSVEGDGSGQTIVVQPPEAAEVLPKLSDFVYVDEIPVLVADAHPKYPEVAREAEVEGDVYVRVLVGKDGRVLDVHVDRGIPMLDQAAIDAAKTWVFKPALCNNRPVAVWVTRRIHFTLSSP